MIVVDSSAVTEVVLHLSAVAAVERRVHDMCETLHAPHLIDAEVAHVVRRYVMRGEVDSERGRIAIGALVDFPVRRHPHLLLLPRVWELRHNLTAYDAVYVALAEALDAPLITRDRRLAASSGHRARIELF
ncbi:MAG TPA: type II toxin-antitoxin system VapC family toxin [Stellaceae bacterium]|nr:type II toxin-antitoxin system VapC family toxin [Stellaceae bacterium]